MNITDKELQERAKEFLKSIDQKSKVCILHDTDPDGICAAVIIGRYVAFSRGKPIDLRLSLLRRKLTEATIAHIKQEKITHLIIADYSAEQDVEAIHMLAKTCKILIIDNHTLYNKLNHPRVILYKPQLFCDVDPTSYCTSKLAYDLVSTLANANSLDWIAAVGSIADVATKAWTDWLELVFKKYRIKPEKDLFETTLGRIASAVVNTQVYDKKLVGTCYDLLYKAPNPQTMAASELLRYKHIIDEQMEKHMEAFEKEASKHGELLIYELSSKHDIQGPLSTLIGLKHPTETVIIINANSHVKVSARRYDRALRVGDLLIRATENFQGANAGGHKHMAGARFDKKYLTEFKKRVIQ